MNLEIMDRYRNGLRRQLLFVSCNDYSHYLKILPPVRMYVLEMAQRNKYYDQS